MSSRINVPKLGTTMTEATLVGWLAEDGSTVAAGDPVCHIESEKVDDEIVAPASGTLRHVAEAGEVYQVGDLLAEIT